MFRETRTCKSRTVHALHILRNKNTHTSIFPRSRINPLSVFPLFVRRAHETVERCVFCRVHVPQQVAPRMLKIILQGRPLRQTSEDPRAWAKTWRVAATINVGTLEQMSMRSKIVETEVNQRPDSPREAARTTPRALAWPPVHVFGVDASGPSLSLKDPPRRSILGRAATTAGSRMRMRRLISPTVLGLDERCRSFGECLKISCVFDPHVPKACGCKQLSFAAECQRLFS